MEKENISLSQLLTLTVNFLLGSSIVIGVGNDAKNDVWIVIIMGAFMGAGTIWMYLQLHNRLPGKNIFQIMEFCLGRKISIVITILYVIYFIYISCRVVRDFEELMATSLMPNTPIEVVGRTSEVFTPYTLGFLLLVGIFLLASGKMNFDQIYPILADGIIPVIKTTFTQILFFPFGELIVFTVLFSSVTNEKYRLRVSLLGVGVASLLLFVSALMQIMTIGVNTVRRSNFPLLSAARNISIGNFIERVDALVVFIIMLGVLIKGTLYLFGSLKGLEYVFHLPYRYFVFPICILIAIFSVLVSVDFADHIQEGLQMVPLYLHIPFQFCIPIMLFALLLWKQRKVKQ
jgi:spore germination protein KB